MGQIFVGIREGSHRLHGGPALCGDIAQVGSGLCKARPINQRKEDEGYGAVRAFDPKTGEQKWEFKMLDVTDAGILTTASDVLFSGGREGYFYALDARNGELAVEGQRGRRRDLWTDIVFGQREAVYLGVGREFVAGVRAEAVTAVSFANRPLPTVNSRVGA